MPNKMTPETKEKIRKTLTGHTVSETTRKKIGLAGKGRITSESTKQKLRDANKRRIYKPLTADQKRKISETLKKNPTRYWLGKKRPPHTKESRIKIGEAQKGEKNYNWKNGITPTNTIIRHSDKYKEWRQQVFIRDNFTCQECGARSGKGKTVYLESHHKTPFHKLLEEARKYLPLLELFEAAMVYTPLWDIDNGETLCDKCHEKKPKKHG